MKKILQRLNIIPTRESTGDAPSHYDWLLKETNPQAASIARTVHPDGSVEEREQ